MSETTPAGIPKLPADPLASVLHALRMSSAFCCKTELSFPWGIDIPPMPNHIIFHLVTEGSCDIELDGESYTLKPGDFMLLPHGRGHIMASGPDAPVTPLFETERTLLTARYEHLVHGGGGEPTTVICGAVYFEHPVAQRIVEILPDFIELKNLTQVSANIRHTIDLMVAEVSAASIGGDALITRLSDIIVIQTIRLWLETDGVKRDGWFAAMQDEQIGKALGLIHHDPTDLWSLDTLSEKVGMSRSAFAARFMQLVGESPMNYVRNWRMQMALDRLKNSDQPISIIAEEYGYESEAAFSRAFKKVIGESPGKFRK